MYCPSCSQTYSSSFKRCPECNCWLKQEEKTAATTSELRGGWSAPPADVGAARFKNPFLDDVEGDESEYGWHAETFEPAAVKPVVDDDWVDEELDLGAQHGWKHPEDFDERGVRVAGSKSRQSGDPTPLLLGAVVGLSLLILGSYLWKQVKSGESATVQPPTLVALEEAEIWLASADESLAKKEYQLAIAQLEKSIDFLVQGEAEQGQVDLIRAKLASALESDGQWEAAHSQWAGLARSAPEARTRKSELEKKLRIKANGLLDQSTSARVAGDPKKAANLAQQALEAFKSYGGSSEQKAQSLESLARANLADNRLVAAESNLQLAQKLSWSEERARLLSSIAPQAVPIRADSPARLPVAKEPVTTHETSRPREADYPQAPPKSPSLTRPISQPRIFNPRTPPVSVQPPPSPPRQPPQYQPPPSAPISSQTSSQEKEHLGDDGVLETYRSTRPKTGSGLPGYR